MFPEGDGEKILAAIRGAEQQPIIRPFDLRKLKRRPKPSKSRIGSVTIPESEPAIREAIEEDITAHAEIQWLLSRMGAGMGLDIWVAPNDRSVVVQGQRLGNMPRVVKHLPTQFDEATSRTIRNIDVLWLRRAAIVAAFEIESTTAIYSGLLRMADLIAMQPNLNIPLYIVAPDDRRDKVISEVNRPVFSRLSQPMSEIVGFVPFSVLRSRFAEIETVLQHLKPSLVEEIAESCNLERVD